jgi:hypothetical protein
MVKVSVTGEPMVAVAVLNALVRTGKFAVLSAGNHSKFPHPAIKRKIDRTKQFMTFIQSSTEDIRSPAVVVNFV